MFDCAACYGNEHQIGEVFKAAMDEGVVERKDLFIMTKVWNDMHRKVEEACTKSIQDLQCDYVDLYFIHCGRQKRFQIRKGSFYVFSFYC